MQSLVGKLLTLRTGLELEGEGGLPCRDDGVEILLPEYGEGGGGEERSSSMEVDCGNRCPLESSVVWRLQRPVGSCSGLRRQAPGGPDEDFLG